MATYNFTDGGQIFIGGVLKQVINGPATFTADPAYYGTFRIAFAGGGDIYYYNDDTFQINGVEFTGDVTEFCVAVAPLFAGSSESGDAYPDITASTTVEIADAQALIFASEAGKNLFKIDQSDTSVIVGDNTVMTAGTGYAFVQSGASSGSTGFSSYYGAYDVGADLGVTATATSAIIQLSVYGPNGEGGLNIEELAIKINGITEYADNAAAITGGLSAGHVYRTGDALKIVH
jgi:hypothetical protein